MKKNINFDEEVWNFSEYMRCDLNNEGSSGNCETGPKGLFRHWLQNYGDDIYHIYAKYQCNKFALIRYTKGDQCIEGRDSLSVEGNSSANLFETYTCEATKMLLQGFHPTNNNRRKYKAIREGASSRCAYVPYNSSPYWVMEACVSES